MWQWFTGISIPVLMVAGVLLSIALFFRDSIYHRIARLISAKHEESYLKIGMAVFWVFELSLFALVVLSLVAITLSREGVHSTLTPQTIERWLLDHGIVILSTIIISLVLWGLLNRFIPIMLRRGLVRTKGESKEGVERRRETLLAVLLGIGKAVIILAVIVTYFLVVPGFDVVFGETPAWAIPTAGE